jgi:hypothetical protein
VLENAGAGTPQNPLGPWATSTTVGIVNPDPAGLGDAAQLITKAIVTGTGGDRPSEDFIVVRTQITDPGTGQPTAIENGMVKFFNESKGFGFVVRGQAPGQPEFD